MKGRKPQGGGVEFQFQNSGDRQKDLSELKASLLYTASFRTTQRDHPKKQKNMKEGREGRQTRGKERERGNEGRPARHSCGSLVTPSPEAEAGASVRFW